MEYQKILNLLNKTNNQPSDFRARAWVVEDEVSKTDKETEFYSFILNSSLQNCDYSGAYTLVKATITIAGARADTAAQRTDGSNS